MRTRTKIIIIAILVVIVASIGIYKYATRMRYNSPDAVGNTAGNLMNGGVFCEYDGYVYFANPYDDDALYKMKLDGSDAKKLIGDSVSYINVCNDYVYYKRHNYQDTVEMVLHGNLYGLYRIKTSGGKTVELHRGIVGNITLSGNYLYFQDYDGSMFHLNKVKIDGEEEERISDTGYVPACVYNLRLYFAEVNANHNVLTLDTATDQISTLFSANAYMPDIYEGYVYYIDCDNGRRLTKRSLTTGEITVLDESSSVINYNLSGEQGVIYYQAENGAEHLLMRTDTEGSYTQVVGRGDFSNISITSTYVYCYRIIGEEKTLYRISTTGVAELERFIIE